MNRRLDVDVFWTLGLASLIGATGAIALISKSFAYEASVASAPVLEYTALQCFAGLAWLTLVVTTLRSTATSAPVRLGLVLITGVVLRILMFDTSPILETDHYRYLWDGAVTTTGHNPYEFSPAEVRSANQTVPTQLISLGQSSTPVLDRVNQPQFTTPYPLIAQSAFAAASLINSFDLEAWRLILFFTELITLLLLLVALKTLGLPMLYCTIYWLNPLVIKEIANTTHVDGLLSPILLVVAISIARRKRWTTLIALAFAAGVKLWPLMLMPFTTSTKRGLVGVGMVSAFVLAALLLPMLTSGALHESGVGAYATHWRINGAAFDVIHFVADAVAGQQHADFIARLAVFLIVVATVITLSTASARQAILQIDRIVIAIATLLLLAPAIYPWYFLWLAALLPLRPRLSLLVLAATLPLYYSRFYFAGVDNTTTFGNVVVWIEFGPVLVLFALELIKRQNFLPTR